MKQRQLNLELLRILCMFFIIVGHIGENSNLGLFSALETIAPHAVNCFVMISGYFLISSSFKAERILRTILETIFYSFIITLILYLCGKASIIDLIKSAIPFAPTKFSYWFINKYIAVLLLSPFINKLCNAISKKQYQILITSMLLLNSTLFTVFPFGVLFGNGFSLMWMITVFITGGYLRLHSLNIRYCGLSTIILLVIYNVCNLYCKDILNLHYNSLITYTLTITTFLWFKDIKIRNSGISAKFIVFIAPHVFASYLIHTQGLLKLSIIDWFNLFQGHMTNGIYLYSFSFVVLILSVIIDKGRIVLFKTCMVDKFIANLSQRINKIYIE